MAIALTLLGTGSPPPDPQRSQPAQVVEIDGDVWLVDCGDGTRARLLAAGIQPTQIRRVIFTHLHADHTLGFAAFVFAGWLRGRTELEIFGPPGTRRFVSLLFDELYGAEVSGKIRSGRPAAGIRDVAVHEIAAGWTLRSESYEIAAFPVIHSIPTFALRFTDGGGRRLVLSSDTTYYPDLAEFARGADVLVHEAYLSPNRYEDQITGLFASLRRSHATPAEAGRIAAAAGVRLLVLTHFLPDIDVAEVVTACRQTYDGPLVVGYDLMRLDA